MEGVATAWFDTPSLVEGAALAGRIQELSAEIVVDLRASGVRVRLRPDDEAEAVSAAARDLELTANPAVLQQLSVVFDSAALPEMRQFWQPVLDYAPVGEGGLADPLRRDPAIRFRQSTEPRPLRNRIHLDVVRPGAAVEQVGLGEASGPYGVCHADPDGNEVDLVPGDA
ncbi:MAG: VOC family protein, partial [Propionibacteriaceae bacterium]